MEEKSFSSIVEDLLEGKKVRRKEWPSDGTYITISVDRLVIYLPKSKTFNPLIVTTGDLQGEDWLVIHEH